MFIGRLQQFEILNFCDKRAQSQTRLNYAERSKNQVKFEILFIAPFPVSPEWGKSHALIKNFEFRIIIFFAFRGFSIFKFSNKKRPFVFILYSFFYKR